MGEPSLRREVQYEGRVQSEGGGLVLRASPGAHPHSWPPQAATWWRQSAVGSPS